MIIHASIYRSNHPAIFAYRMGCITAEELFTLPITGDYPYVVKGNTIYANDGSASECSLPEISYGSLPRVNTDIDNILLKVNKPLVEFDHIQDLVKASRKVDSVSTPTNVIDVGSPSPIQMTVTPLTQDVPTCSDVSLDQRYQDAKDKILKEGNPLWVKEIIVVDNVLLSRTSSCAKRGRIKSFLDLYTTTR